MRKGRGGLGISFQLGDSQQNPPNQPQVPFSPGLSPLQSGVSKHTSANCPLLTCSSFGATSEKMTEAVGIPRCLKKPRTLGSPWAGKRSSHNTLLGTRFRMRAHDSRMRGHAV